MFSQNEWKDMFKDIYQGDVGFNISMKNYTSLKIGGPADVLVSPEDPLSLRNLIVILREKGIPFFPLGGGTNILIMDNGIKGVVISLKAFKRIEVLKEGNRNVELFIEAGASWQGLVNFCKEHGYSGIEGLVGIPGTVGGAICGNAGSFGYEVKNALVSVAILDSYGRLERFKTKGLGFGYRKSDIKQEDIVLSANLRLKRDEKKAVSERTENFFREKKQKQPISESSAGCAFKNPEGESTGRLIDKAGCKGIRVGDIEVSTVHANFFINRGNGNSSDYITLMNEVLLKVKNKFGIELEREIRVVGRE
jgi:UDP-N-acetylmuramate dehydrogenase